MRSLLLLLTISLISGCAGTLGTTGDENLTVGTVQREIYLGMSGAEVASVLGSPNVVTTDEYRNESWIYDKISTQSVETDSFGVTSTLRFVDAWGPIAGSSHTNRQSSSQRTLTVIIKFDEFGEVRDFAYHTSRF